MAAREEQTTGSKEFSAQLQRSKKDRIIAGVAGGLGEYFQIDSTIFRLIFILLTIFGGSGILIYLILWLIIPSADKPSSKRQLGENVEELRTSLKNLARNFTATKGAEQPKVWWGILLIGVGILFLLSNFNLFDIFQVERFWPLILVILGLILLTRQR